jgi:sulfopyruvate decarboxylase subunit alpha
MSMGNPDAVARRITEELAASRIKLVTSLPDNWINKLLDVIDADDRFEHIPVNREESAVGLCSGAYMGGVGSVALMGASGFMTLIYALTKINYTYNIPIFMMVTLRGDFNDPQKAHVSNGLYLRPIMDSINMSYALIEKPEDLHMVSRVYGWTKRFFRPAVAVLTRDLLC